MTAFFRIAEIRKQKNLKGTTAPREQKYRIMIAIVFADDALWRPIIGSSPKKHF